MRATIAAGVIKAVHGLLYARDPEAARAFFRDVLELPYVDDGGGWLIFALPPAELGIHPPDGEQRAKLYLMCDDLEGTIAELEAKGVELAGPPSDQPWGRLVNLRVPGLVDDLGLYEPRHASPLAL
jgi:predicted enzyme related to lactoylglutathione lyase